MTTAAAQEAARERADIHLMLIREIGDLLDRGGDLDLALGAVVDRLAGALGFEVVSIYLWNRGDAVLELRASHGLVVPKARPFRLSPGEGLTGYVFETQRPLTALPASAHPRFRALEGSGELDYESYLGVPVALGTRALGVLVAQTRGRRGITPAEQMLFEIVAARLAGLLDIATHFVGRGEREHGPRVLQGRSVATGLAVGPAVCLSGPTPRRGRGAGAATPEDERARLEAATASVGAEIEGLIERLGGDGRLEGADVDILRFHRTLLSDPGLLENLDKALRTPGLTAERAVERVLDEQADRLRAAPIAYLAARAGDLVDLRDRLLERLESGDERSAEGLPEGAVVLAEDVGPLLFARLVDARISGLVTVHGGAGSHTAILAQSLGIPAVSGVPDALRIVRPGDPVLVDGRTGIVVRHPDPGLVADFEAQQRQAEDLRARLAVPEGDLAEDGLDLTISANVGFPADIEAAGRFQLRAAGLARSEFFFLTRTTRPDVAAQTAHYSRLAAAFPDGVTIRTLDIGGDKRLPYVEFPPEDNPMLGLRGIRYTMEHLDLLTEQIEAIVATHAAGHKVRILLPMVSHLWELKTAGELLRGAGEAQGIDVDALPPLGMMLEAPAMLWQLDDVARHVDFLTVGTNDLAQYLLAVDRGSSVVGHLYSPLHPAVLRALGEARRTAARLGLPIGVCGELAGRPSGALALAALGYRELSVAPSRAPLLAHLARHTPATALDEVADAVLAASDVRETEDALRAALARFAPLLREFDDL